MTSEKSATGAADRARASLPQLLHQAKSLRAATSEAERVSEQQLQEQLAIFYEQVPKDFARVQEALRLLLQSRSEFFALLTLAKTQAERLFADTTELRRFDGHLRKVETALKLVEDLLALRQTAQTLQKLLQAPDVDTERAAALIAEFHVRLQQSAFHSQRDLFGSAEVAALQQQVEEARHQLRALVVYQAEQVLSSAASAPEVPATSEHPMQAHIMRLHALGYVDDARRLLVQYTKAQALSRMSQRTASALEPETAHLEELTALYEAIAETIAYTERSAQHFDSDDGKVILALEELANERGAEILQRFCDATKLAERCRQLNRRREANVKAATESVYRSHAGPVFDIEYAPLSNMAAIGDSRTGATAHDFDMTREQSETNELEALLEQIVVMSRRTAMFRHFMMTRLGLGNDFEQERRREGALYLKMQEVMGMYVLLERALLDSEWKLAQRLEALPASGSAGEPPAASSETVSRAIDYTFYAIKRIIGRSLQAFDPDALCASLNHVQALLAGPLLEHLRRSLPTHAALPSVFPSAQMVFGSSFRAEELEGLIKVANDARTSGSYLRHLVTVSVSRGLAEQQLPRSAALTAIISDLETTIEELRCVASQGVRRIFQTLVSNVLEQAATHAERLLLGASPTSGASNGSPYLVSESSFQPGPSAFVTELFEQMYRGGLDRILAQLEPENTAELVCLVSEWTRDRLDQAIRSRSLSMNALGGLIFDADVRYLVNRFAGLVLETQRANIRAIFRPLIHMALVLTVDRPAEVLDLWEQIRETQIPDRVRQLLRMRVEFRAETIASLELPT
jgi:hypothetical protein